MTVTFARNMVAVGIFALACLRAFQAVRSLWTLFAAVFADPASRTATTAVERVTCRVVFAQAFVLAVAPPKAGGTGYKT